MENRFLEMDEHLKQVSCKKGRRGANGSNGHGRGGNAVASSLSSYTWAQPFSAQDRALVILIENGGVDLGIPELVDLLLSALPGSSLIPDSYRSKLVQYIKKKIKGFTDNLLESAELAVNRYSAAKPDFFGDVTILRDGTASYEELKDKLIALSGAGKIVDVVILTHGGYDSISVGDGINGEGIRKMRAANGRPLSIRSVYMMNCVGSSLNQAWIDAGAKVSSGALKINYLPEPTTYFFWKNWKDGQTFENAVTSAYRSTINLMNEAVRTFVRDLPILGSGMLADRIDFAGMDFVKDSAPVIEGQGSLTINSDDLTFSQSTSSGLSITVLPTNLLRSLAASEGADSQSQPRTLSQQGVDFIKGWEGFRTTMYNDPVGHCTIGYGTLLHTGNCDGRSSEQPYANGITEEQATELLVQKAAQFQQIVNNSVQVALNQNQNDALVSFVYNVGGNNFRNSTLLRLLNQGNYGAVPTELKKWTKARQDGKLVSLPGLVRRRDAEAELFQKPVPATVQSLSRFTRGRYARPFSGVDQSISGTLPVLAQPTPNTCWATVFTMMYSWKINASISIRDALARIGPRYVDMFEQDIGLDSASARVLYNDAGLVPIESFNPTIEGWASFLKDYGPLYVDVGYNQPGAGTHAIIVTRIFGGGSPNDTSITYVDPIGGRTVTLKFMDFLAKYEAQSAVVWPYTIVHWPAGAQTSMQNSLPRSYSQTTNGRSPRTRITQTLASPLTFDASEWKQLISFRPPIAIQSVVKSKGYGWHVHQIEDGYSDINLDFYPVSVTRLPTIAGRTASASDLLSHIRLNINSFVDTDICEFSPYDDTEAKVWQLITASTPLGAVIHIDMKSAHGWLNMDDGSVVVSEFAPDYWIFSTIWTIGDGGHPVSGNRQFGFMPDNEGGYVFYTRGADRATSVLDAGAMSILFAAANDLWLSLQQRIAAFVNSNGGAASIGTATSIRTPWAAIQSTYHHPTVGWV